MINAINLVLDEKFFRRKGILKLEIEKIQHRKHHYNDALQKH